MRTVSVAASCRWTVSLNAHLMRMWPISTRVNKPENDDPSIIEPIELATDAA
jgi:putative SOS response-associated peptidase YedK